VQITGRSISALEQLFGTIGGEAMTLVMQITGRSVSALEQLFGTIGGEAMTLVKQMTTAGLGPISKYEYIVPQLSKCYLISQIFLLL